MNRDIQQLRDRIEDDSPLYSATFIFRARGYDEEFHELNDRINEIAHDSPGFLGKEWWDNEEEGLQAVTYYWESLEELKTFSRHPDHQEAKSKYKKWYSGYEIIISEVLGIRFDRGLENGG